MATLDPAEGIALITDGSADYRDRSGGWAWVAIDALDGLEKASGHRSDTTNNQMELLAPRMGLEYLHDKYGRCEVLVYSDSQYVVFGVNDPSRSRKKNKGYWKDLDRAIQEHEYVQFVHIKGHSDHLYNEMADQMAGQARLKGLM